MNLNRKYEYIPHLMQVSTGRIEPEHVWIREFYDTPLCKWYKCSGDCEADGHPDIFDESESGLVEVECVGLDEDGDEIWEKV